MRYIRLVIYFISAALFPGVAKADALSELKARRDLTPESFIRSFATFGFELGDRLQEPAAFLQRHRGDCDDFASLAAAVLNERGYRTKVVVVMMNGATHVVCYVQEAHGYLDFNHRADAHPIIESDGSLEDIANKTAAYFRLRWSMASEVRYEKNTPVYLTSVFCVGAPEKTANANFPRRDINVSQSAVAMVTPAATGREASRP